MKVFNGDSELRESLLAKLKHHQELDAFVQGAWLTNDKVEGNGFKGCFYGCVMQSKDYPIEKFSEKYGIPLWYCYLTERIFEGLPEYEAKKFPYESINVLEEGVAFNKARSLFTYKMLEDQLRFCKEDKKSTKAIQQCMELFKVDFDKIDSSAAWSAAGAADRSAWAAARSAAWSAARAAWAAARAAAGDAWAAEKAARAAAWDAEAAAEKQHYVFLRDILFESIESCK